jgi:hypothetical protein
MELANELFDQVVGALGASAQLQQSKRDAEQRRAARLTIAADVVIERYGMAASQPRTVKLLSLSRTGAAVLDNGTMRSGDKVILHLPKPGGASVPLVCMVANTRVSGGAFRLGMQFLSTAEQTGPAVLRAANGIVSRPVSEGHVHVLDQIALNGVDPTKSGREHRVELNVQALMSPYTEGLAATLNVVTLKDISPGGGLCVLHHEELKREDQFVLQVPRPQGKPLTMLCTVVDCRRLNDAQFRIGARFETKLSESPSPAEKRGLIARLRRWLAA